MSDLAIATILAIMILVASAISIEIGIASAIIEIIFGVIAGNMFHIQPTNWLIFIATFGSIVLTFLAGTEVNLKETKGKLWQSVLVGAISFIVPFVAVFFFTLYGLHWSMSASKIAGIALSTTSLAVVYAILVETGLERTQLGKVIMATTFVTDFLTALALSVLFVQFNTYTIIFAVISFVVLLFGPRFVKFFFDRYKNKVIEPEIKLIFCIFFLLMFFAQLGKTEAILPVFVLGLLMAPFAETHRRFSHKMRTVAYAFITPFFFIKGGMNVDIGKVISSWPTVLGLLALKIGSKIIGIYPVARMSVPRKRSRMFFTLLMSTGLTFGTISSTFGLANGYINEAQFSILIAIVILSAIVPTFLAQRFFRPVSNDMRNTLQSVGEEGRALHSHNEAYQLNE